MKIEQLIKLINDVKKITKQNKIMLFGSQAIYSKIKDVESDTILNSMEADFTKVLAKSSFIHVGVES